MAKKISNQMKIIKLIVKLNPKVTASEAGEAYNLLKNLGGKR